MTIKDANSYLDSLGFHKIKPGLERIGALLRRLGNPQDKVPAVIVGGTNGKGSVTAAISAVLGREGYLTGDYTSPHLVSITERIKLGGEEISPDDLARIIFRVKDAADAEGESPSYFEVVTAAAFVYFAGRGADFMVLEVGMGGRWDATNVTTPLVSVITNVSMDHTEYLGRTLPAIALEKACIIKPGAPVVTAARGAALGVITDYAREAGSHAYIHGRDFRFSGGGTSDFTYSGREWKLPGLTSNLAGLYQLENLSVALAALEAFSLDCGIDISEAAVRAGLADIRWPGRLETLRESPPLILDSAHNPGGGRALVKSLRALYPGTKFTFLVGMLDDKRHGPFLKEIAGVAGRLIITEVPSSRTTPAEKLLGAAAKYVACEITVIKDYAEAYGKLLDLNEPSCIAGSIYLAGAIRKLVQTGERARVL
ncbi:MAG TPA: folylpolyglutamate synthase/dihydrofolate synthase family protein [Thermodesulfobacteriota bacterium]|nr:folylpolyglutamate synthase/dihydrofolate synthase family protein [Thermodesulfobacteriota bacterium]